MASRIAQIYSPKTGAPRDIFVDVSGVRTRYIEAGNPDDKTLVLVHGILSDANSWNDNISALSKIRRVIAPDLPGFGKSGNPTSTPTQEYFISFIGEFMKKLSIDRTDIVGHSMGGGIVIGYALTHPEIIKSMTAEDPYGLYKPVPVAERILEHLPSIISHKLDYLIKMITGKEHVNLSKLLESVKEEVQIEGRSAPTTLAWLESEIEISSCDKIRFKTDYISQIYRLADKKTMWIVGGHDPLFSVLWVKEAAKRAKGEFVDFTNAGHDPQEETSSRFNKKLIEFLSSKGI